MSFSGFSAHLGQLLGQRMAMRDETFAPRSQLGDNSFSLLNLRHWFSSFLVCTQSAHGCQPFEQCFALKAGRKLFNNDCRKAAIVPPDIVGKTPQPNRAAGAGRRGRIRIRGQPRRHASEASRLRARS
jgi:hypothetical protein